jgi:lipoprotein signal peptidase
MEMDLVSIMQAYFHGEKVESILMVAASIVILVVAGLLFFVLRHPFAKGLAVVLLLTAIVAGSVGGAIVLRTDKQLTSLVSLYRTDPQKYWETEGARMAAVVKSFIYYRVLYGAACLVALLLVFASGRPVLHGVAVGLLLFGALGLTIDYFALDRAERYVAEIRAETGEK